ncbi:porin [bacterium]|nr:porin [bacterium]
MRKIFILFALLGVSSGQQVYAEAQISVGGLIEVGYEKIGDGKGNLGAGDIEVGIEAKLNEQISGAILLRPDAEEIGDILDEVIITLENFSQAPISITAGKTAMPFGVFESHLLSDPWTKEAGDTWCWEIGGVVGLIGSYAQESVEVSLAVYDCCDNEEPCGIAGMITVAPMENFSASLSYCSQKEDVDTTTAAMGDVNLSLTYAAGPVTVDVEYSGAMTRENGEPKPSAYSAGLAYQASEPLEVALRYDGLNDDDGTATSPASRIGAGINYTLFEAATLSCEIGSTKPGEDDSKTDFAAKLAIEF